MFAGLRFCLSNGQTGTSLMTRALLPAIFVLLCLLVHVHVQEKQLESTEKWPVPVYQTMLLSAGPVDQKNGRFCWLPFGDSQC